MNLGAAGTALIQGFESCRLTAYQDPRGIWTIGWGHTPASSGQTCTQAQADAWLQADVAGACGVVNRNVDIAMTQNQFDALVSFTYNVGGGAFVGSTLLRLVNQHCLSAAADEFLRWDHIDGQTSAGLARRRAAERALFLAA